MNAPFYLIFITFEKLLFSSLPFTMYCVQKSFLKAQFNSKSYRIQISLLEGYFHWKFYRVQRLFLTSSQNVYVAKLFHFLDFFSFKVISCLKSSFLIWNNFTLKKLFWKLIVIYNILRSKSSRKKLFPLKMCSSTKNSLKSSVPLRIFLL